MYLNNLNHVEILQIHKLDTTTGFANKKYGCIQMSCVSLHYVYF